MSCVVIWEGVLGIKKPSVLRRVERTHSYLRALFNKEYVGREQGCHVSGSMYVFGWGCQD